MKIKLKLPHFHGGDSHPEMSSSPGIVGLARAHPLTKTQAVEPSRQTWSSHGPPYPLERWRYFEGCVFHVPVKHSPKGSTDITSCEMHSRAVTTHAKPHAQQQLARDLAVSYTHLTLPTKA